MHCIEICGTAVCRSSAGMQWRVGWSSKGVPPSTARGVPGVTSDYPSRISPLISQHCSSARLLYPLQYLPNIPRYCHINTDVSKILANTPLGLINFIYGRQYRRMMKSQQSVIWTTSEPALLRPTQISPDSSTNIVVSEWEASNNYYLSRLHKLLSRECVSWCFYKMKLE